MDTLKLLLSVICFCFVGRLRYADAKCKFPKEWKGKWYQSGLGEVSIRTHAVIGKGVCKATKDEYFLVENKERNCYQCLLMMKRHKNLIQYKETFCMESDNDDLNQTLRTLCANIRVETNLYTIVRDPAEAITCPFQDAYYFNYDDSMYGTCEKPISYIQPCAGDSKFRFHFKHCVPYAELNGKNQDFECLASWKEGSNTYMYGQFSAPGIMTKEDGYRCFIYQAYGNDIFMSMSADATCRGVQSAKEGHVRMEFSKDLFGWPQTTCTFPDWFTSTTWKDMAGRNTYSPEGRGDIINVYHQRRLDSKAHIQNELRCIEMLDKNDTEKSFKAVSFTSHGCVSKHQCIKIVARQNQLVEIHTSKLIDSEDVRKCPDDKFDDVQIVIDENVESVNCPFPGKYTVQSTDPNCQGQFTSGCMNSSVLAISNSCLEQKDKNLECLISWKEKHTTFVITREYGATHSIANCFSFRKGGDMIEFARDRQCNRGAPNIFESAFSFTLSGEPEKCRIEKEPRESANTPGTKSTDSRDTYRVQSEHKNKDSTLSGDNISNSASQLMKTVTCHLMILVQFCGLVVYHWS